MATLTGKYERADAVVRTYAIATREPRAAFTVSPISRLGVESQAGMETFMEGEFSNPWTRLRTDPVHGIVLTELGWKKLPCP